MRPGQGQLIETLKFLTFQFVSSLEKLTSLHGEHLAFTKHELFSRILALIEFQKHAQLLQDYAKMLERSYEDTLKNECFQKDLSISLHNQEVIEVHEVSKISRSFEENDSQDQRKKIFDDSFSKLNGNIFSCQRATEVTKYNSDINEIYQDLEGEEFECKREEQTPVNGQELSASFEENSESVSEVSQEEVKQEEQCKEEEDQDQDQDGQADSSYSMKEESEKESDSLRDNIVQMTSRYTSPRKRYRSYTEQQRQQAIIFATQMGIEFTCRTLNIPRKNITRWMKRKSKGQKVRGRKPGDPNMELNLTNWIISYIAQRKYLTQTEIREKAREFSGDKSFKASKGWLEKYFRRNHLINEGLNSLLMERRYGSTGVKKESVEEKLG